MASSAEFAEEKTFKLCDKASLNISASPSGFSTFVLYIRDSPFFAVGGVYSPMGIELPDIDFYYNHKSDLLLEEDFDPGEHDKCIHKLNFYKENNQYRFDFVPLNGDTATDKWREFVDLEQGQRGTVQMDMVRRFTDLLAISNNEPAIIAVSDIPHNQMPLEDSVGIVMFRRLQ